MKLGALCVLAGTAVLAGCSTTSAPTPPATARATAATIATPANTVTAPGTASPQTTTTSVAVAPSATRASNVPLSLYQKGQADLSGHRYKAAKAEFTQALLRHQDTAASYIGLGTATLGLGQYSTAYKSYRAGFYYEPANADVAYLAAAAGYYANDYRGSTSYANKYIQLRPYDPKGYKLRFLDYGKLLLAKGQVQDGRVLVKLQPTNPEAYRDLGIGLANDKHVREAIAAFDHAIQLQPRNPINYSNRATAELLETQPTLAIADLRKARSLSTDPVQQKALDHLINVLTKKPAH